MSDQKDASVESQATETDSTASNDKTPTLVKGVMGLKSGMTQLFNEAGNKIPVTVIELSPQYVTQVKTKEKDGYVAIQVGFNPRKAQRVTRPEKGHAKVANQPGFSTYIEFEPNGDSIPEAGAELSVGAAFKVGDRVDVRAKSKGKGFQGGMKRWGFSGIMASHGAGPVHRSLGSTGMHTYPGRTFKGKKMAGQMGNKYVTVQNLEVISVDQANRLLIVKGSVPGAKNGILEVRPSVKA